jgi:hypothetical protein
MKRLFLAALCCLLVSNVVAAEKPTRAELLGDMRVVEDAVEPEFVDLTAEQLQERLEVVSSRCSAFYGFNNPEVQIHLPPSDNSVYAAVEFSSPRLLDAEGNEVRYELERGIYDHDTHSDEIRFAPADGGQTVASARAEGSITLRYPIRMRTVAITAGGSAPARLTVTIDGPFVSWSDPQEVLPKAASFTPIEQLRAFDPSGRRLEQHPWKGFSMSGGVSVDTYAFWGEVAELRIDVVDEWADLEITYLLPSIEPLPAAMAGTAPESTVAEPTPGGTVDIRVIGPDRHQGEEPAASMSKEQALAELRELGFQRFDANSFILAATRGKAEALSLFIAAGMPVDTQAGGRTALMSAAMLGRVEAGKVLIDAGADVNQTDSTGSPPLSRLVMQCDATELVRTFIDAGADLSVELPGGTTLRQMAELSGCTENAKVLQAAGAR